MPARAQRGASMVELMIGLVISLLVGLAATGAAMTFSAQQRSGVAVSSASVNSGSVMSVLRDDVATAGLGFFGEGAFLCPQLQLSLNATNLVNGTNFSPIQVTRQTDADVLDILYAHSVESGATVRLHEASDGSTALLKSLLPVAVGQTVLLTPAPASGAATPCLARTVTAVVDGTAAQPRQQLSFDVAGKHNAVVFASPANFNTDGRVTLLGDLRWSRYRLSSGQLLLERPLTGASVVVARDVVAFRVQYGVSANTAGSTSIESWTAPTGTFASLGAANVVRVRAMRIGLVVRGSQRQKPDANGVCDATPSGSPPQLFGATADNLASDWTCYRYRTSEVMVPLRNVAMGLR